MTEHYYSATPTSESRPIAASYTYRGRAFTLMTDSGVFSRGELDSGTRILLNALPEELSGDILDLGCGWGAVGVTLGVYCPACRITFSDINARALSLCQSNARQAGVSGAFIQSDAFADIHDSFDIIITNPPIRTGKQVIYPMFSQCADHLKPGGTLYLVIRKQQGAPSAIAFLKTVFETVEVIDKSGGFWVIRCKNGGIVHEV